jgi:hypothetical protein
MTDKEIIFKWLDDIFENKIPAEIEAIYINLVEWQTLEILQVEFYGISQFEKEDADWACDFVFHSQSVDISFKGSWEKSLSDVVAIMSMYLDSQKKDHRSASIKRVGVGFGDSEIVLIKDNV